MNAAFCSFFFFFFCFHAFLEEGGYCSMNSSRKCWLFSVNSASVHCLRTHKFHFLSIFSLKMGPTSLFTHLKIILLQCFQFSVFSFSKISSIQTHPKLHREGVAFVQDRGFITSVPLLTLHKGCVCFDFKPLSEMLFRKCGCLVAQEKYIFRKLFEVYQENEPLTTEMVWSSNFHFKPFPGQTRKERRRERERARARERKPDHAFDVAGEAQIVVFGSDDRTLQSDDREEAQIVRSSPTIARSSSTIERKPRSHAPVRRSISPSISLLDLASAQSRPRPTDLSLWFWFLLLLCGGVVVVFGWLWLLIARICCRGLNWSFGGVWCWLWFWNFFNKICLDAEKIIKKMWKFCRKIAFS